MGLVEYGFSVADHAGFLGQNYRLHTEGEVCSYYDNTIISTCIQINFHLVTVFLADMEDKLLQLLSMSNSLNVTPMTIARLQPHLKPTSSEAVQPLPSSSARFTVFKTDKEVEEAE